MLLNIIGVQTLLLDTLFEHSLVNGGRTSLFNSLVSDLEALKCVHAKGHSLLTVQSRVNQPL